MRQVAFLRAVNVAGHGRVTMADLTRGFAAAGCRNATTLIQSGNVLFDDNGVPRAPLLAGLRRTLTPLLGGEPQIALRSLRQVQALVRRAPFAAFEDEAGIKLYVVFLLAARPAAAVVPPADAREQLEVAGMTRHEVFVASRRKPNGMYGFPNAFVERACGVAATTRNWSTVRKILEVGGSNRTRPTAVGS
jgi:uncharacterized protein (DUF1697 family)